MRIDSEQAMRALGAEWALRWRAGTTVLLEGPLGAGKTTFVRGLLHALGVREPVRSPTFNLVHAYDTSPPVVHCDLYRVTSAEGLGLEDLMADSLLLIEWPDRDLGRIDPDACWHVNIQFDGEGRRVEISEPARGRGSLGTAPTGS